MHSCHTLLHTTEGVFCCCCCICNQLFAQVPKVSLTEMGPSIDCVLRRSRLPAVDLEKEALKQPKLTKKKVGRGVEICGWQCLTVCGWLLLLDFGV